MIGFIVLVLIPAPIENCSFSKLVFVCCFSSIQASSRKKHIHKFNLALSGLLTMSFLVLKLAGIGLSHDLASNALEHLVWIS